MPRPDPPPPRPEPGFLGMTAALVALGAVVAGGVWLFKQVIARVAWAGTAWHGLEGGLGAALALGLVPVAGGLVVGLLYHRVRLPEEPGHGVTEVIEAVTLDVHEMPHAQIAVKAPAAAVSLGSGASLGPEDPAVEIGGSFGAFAGARWGWPHASVQTLVAAGAAAGVSAAFHAPLAAVVFTVEVFRVRPLGRRLLWVAVAALAAYATMRLLAPDTVFRIPEQTGLNGWLVLGFGLGLGAVAGVAGAGLIRGMYALQRAMLRWSAPPRWAKPALGGVVLGLAGLVLPEALGIGYETIQAVVRGERLAAPWLLALLAGKLALTAISFGAGFPGGFFAPSFFAGAMLGAALGVGAEALVGVAPTTLAVAGMAALLAAVVHAPLTAVLLLVAVSDTYTLVPLLLVAALTGFAVSRRLADGSAYTYAFAHPERRQG